MAANDSHLVLVLVIGEVVLVASDDALEPRDSIPTYIVRKIILRHSPEMEILLLLLLLAAVFSIVVVVFGSLLLESLEKLVSTLQLGG